MKSYNNLYQPILDEEYLKKCFKDSAKGKTKRRDVQKILSNLDEEAKRLKDMLEHEMFIPDYHERCVINEGSNRKVRRILKPSYKYEQVVHHCVIGQFKDIVLKGLYEFSCGSIPGRGIHYGMKYMKKWLKSYKGRKMYVLKMDVHHFFESIDRVILKRKLKEVIRDKRFYRLMCIIVEHDRVSEAVRILEKASPDMSEDDVRDFVSAVAFDDDLSAFSILKKYGVADDALKELTEIIRDRRKGVPLGYFTSQWFGNFYLKKLDHYIKQELHAEHYMRYMDDMVILGRNKKKLHAMQRTISEYLDKELNLELKGDWQVFRFEYESRDGNVYGRALDFMGFKFHYNRVTMRKSILYRIRRKANRIKKKGKSTWYDGVSMLSYLGWFRYTDTYGYFKKYIHPCINMRVLRKLVSRHQRKVNKCEKLAQSNRVADNETGGN